MSQLWIDVEMGVGTATGQGSDPQLMLQTSRMADRLGATSYGIPSARKVVRQRRAIFRRLGRAFDWVFQCPFLTRCRCR